jgi:hypothetical protein
MAEKPPRPLIERRDDLHESAPEAPASQEPQVKRGRRGRIVGLTPRIQEIICEVIAAGNYQKVAAQAAGISEETLIKWRAKGRRGTEPYASLEKAIEQADRECEQSLVAKVMAATSDDWRAAAMILERKYPEHWSRYRERSLFEAGNPLARAGFVINIHIGERREEWEEQVRERGLELEARKHPKVIDVTPIAVAAPKPPPVKDPDPNPNLN